MELVAVTSSVVRDGLIASVMDVCGLYLVTVGPINTPHSWHLVGYDETPEGLPRYWTFGTEDEAWNVARAWAEGRRKNARKH